MFTNHLFSIIFSVLRSALELGERAYLDPGSGSYLLQVLLAALLGSLFFLRTFWSRIVAYFRKGPAETESDAPEPPEDHDGPPQP